MPRRYDSAAAKRRILSVCVRLFIEKGYRGTRMADIIHAADVSSSTFQNIFHSKDGVLMELVQFMFENQFALANSLTMGNTAPALLYAVETSIQLALAEINENLREIYVEAYTLPEPSAYIHRQTAVELQRLFSAYLPDCDSRDFYEMEIGTAGIMRAYMLMPCDSHFTLERKLERFLRMTLGVYAVPEAEQQAVLAHISQLDICSLAMRAMHALFEALAMKYDFQFPS